MDIVRSSDWEHLAATVLRFHFYLKNNASEIMQGIKWLLRNEQHQHSKIAKYEIVFFTIYRQWNHNGMQKCDDECDSIWFSSDKNESFQNI